MAQKNLRIIVIGGGAAGISSASTSKVVEQGNADDREKHRDTENNKSIHPKLLH